MGEIVPLVNPLPAELAVTIEVRLRPSTLPPKPLARRRSTCRTTDGSSTFRRPRAHLRFMSTNRRWRRGRTDIWMLQPGRLTLPNRRPASVVVGDDRRAARFRVLGVSIARRGPRLVARHEEELGHLAVYVSGAHTILAHPDDCRTCFRCSLSSCHQKSGNRSAGNRPALLCRG